MSDKKFPFRLSGYEFKEHLADGGMARVYLAHRIRPQGFCKPVAVKIVQDRGDGAGMRVAREANLVSAITHEHIIEVLDYEVVGEFHCLVMEYMDSGSLSHSLKTFREQGRRIELAPALTIVLSVAQALLHLHTSKGKSGQTLGVIHRDVSPSNILLNTKGEVKLSDFGVARLAGDQESGEFVAGKTPYLPYEAFRGSTPCESWDLYALCVVAYEMLSGRLPFDGIDEEEVVSRIGQGTVALHEVRPDLPIWLSRLFARGMNQDRSLPLSKFVAQLEDKQASFQLKGQQALKRGLVAPHANESNNHVLVRHMSELPSEVPTRVVRRSARVAKGKGRKQARLAMVVGEAMEQMRRRIKEVVAPE